MLLLHEVHRVAGRCEEEFDIAFRDGLIPKLAESDGSRLIWYLRLAHGSGAAYTVVTYTACRDAAAWAELAERMRVGDLARWSSEVDAMRHGCEAKILTPTSFSPLQEIDFATVPTKGEEHELSLFMEDTAWPFQGGLANYLEKAATLYDRELATSKQRGAASLSSRRRSSRSTARTPPTRSCCGSASSTTRPCSGCSATTSRPRRRRPAPGCTTRARRARPLGEPDPAQRGVVAPVLST